MNRASILSATVLAGMLCCIQGTVVGADWPDLSLPLKAIGGGEKDAAVIVGVENYTYVEHVPGAKQNATDWQAYLTQTLKVPADRVTLLLDTDATNDAIRVAVAEKAAQTEPEGTLWFVFIGHGSPSKDGQDGLLVGVDAQQKAASVYSRSFSRNELLGTLAKGKQAKTVVLLDACFSGKSSSGQALVAGLQPLLTMRGLSPGIDSRTILMTAAKSDQFAGPLPGGARPAFSYLALGALRGWAANEQGQVTASSLVDYIRRALSLSRDRTQTPELSTPERALVVLGNGREAGPDLAKLQREAATTSGGGFQFSNLPVMPTADAPKELGLAASGLDLGNVDVDALEKYDGAMKFEKGDADPEEKAFHWLQLAQDVPKFADMAKKRAAEWDRFAALKKTVDEARNKRIEARDTDWSKLGRLLGLGVVSESDKIAWSSQFLKAYWNSPGIEPDMAKGLFPHMAEGAMQETLKKLALKSPQEEVAASATGKAGIQWVRIPGGTFTMGDGNGTEWPRHSVTVRTFQMAKTLVTNKQYKACVDAGACTSASSPGSTFEGYDQPVVGVDWNQANAFSKWVGGRLPNEAEWEYAARSAGKDQAYPWGDDAPTCERAAFSGCGEGTALVCSKAMGNTKQGLCDMAGNVWEWVEDWYHDSYKGAPMDGSVWDSPVGSSRVIRGGSFGSKADGGLRADYRDGSRPDSRVDGVGFRVAR